MSDKYVFIDRDGVINKDPGGWTKYGYVTVWKDFYFLPGVLAAMEKLSRAGYKSVVISNQQGVGKGYFTEEDLNDVTKKFMRAIEENGGSVEGIYYCIHKKEENCRCRKPKTGLLELARKELEIQDFDGKFLVGDNKTDIETGEEAGLKTILVLSGKSSREDIKTWKNKPDYICEDLLDATELIIGDKDRDPGSRDNE